MWLLIQALCHLALQLLGPFIYVVTLMLVPASFSGLVATALLPGVSQIYWIVALWSTKPAAAHLLADLAVWFVALFGLWLLACWKARAATEDAAHEAAEAN